MKLVDGEGVRVFANPQAVAREADYEINQRSILCETGFAAARGEIASWPGYAVTRLVLFRDRSEGDKQPPRTMDEERFATRSTSPEMPINVPGMGT